MTNQPNKRQPAEDIVGQRFGRIVVLRNAARGKRSQRRVDVRCDCGKEWNTSEPGIKCGDTRSCGCLHRDTLRAQSTTHGMSDTGEHRSWEHMRGRCENENNPRYSDYGGRGIKICERWQAFENFLADMGKRPSPAHSLDRIDVNGNYEPGNCRWATPKEQSRNRRVGAYFELAGERLCLAEWADRFALPYTTLSTRVHRGWSLERALTTPVQQRRRAA